MPQHETSFGNVTVAEPYDGGCHSKVWDSALALCKVLERFDLKGRRVLELGAGVGLTGLYAASMGAHVTLTDLPLALPTLEANRDRECNRVCVAASGGRVDVQALDWLCDEDISRFRALEFDFIVGADLLAWVGYDILSEDPVDGLQRVCVGLAGQGRRVLLVHKTRNPEREARFFQRLQDAGVRVETEDVSSVAESVEDEPAALTLATISQTL